MDLIPIPIMINPLIIFLLKSSESSFTAKKPLKPSFIISEFAPGQLEVITGIPKNNASNRALENPQNEMLIKTNLHFLIH